MRRATATPVRHPGNEPTKSRLAEDAGGLALWGGIAAAGGAATGALWGLMLDVPAARAAAVGAGTGAMLLVGAYALARVAHPLGG